MAKRTYLIILLVFLLGILGCKTASQPAKKPAAPVKYKISGAGTGIPLLKILADAFTAEHPEVKFEFLPEVHTTGGIKGTEAGTLDIGILARKLKPEEEVYRFHYFPVAKVGIVMAINSEVSGVNGITSQQVRDIYAGRITNWQALGGPNADIVILDRNEDGSAKIYLREKVLGADLKITDRATVLYHEGDLADTLATTPNAIGYLAYSEAKKRQLKILALDGVEPSMENVKNEKYSLVRLIGIVVKKQPQGNIKKFIDFLGSAEAKKLMRTNGYVAE